MEADRKYYGLEEMISIIRQAFQFEKEDIKNFNIFWRVNQVGN